MSIVIEELTNIRVWGYFAISLGCCVFGKCKWLFRVEGKSGLWNDLVNLRKHTHKLQRPSQFLLTSTVCCVVLNIHLHLLNFSLTHLAAFIHFVRSWTSGYAYRPLYNFTPLSSRLFIRLNTETPRGVLIGSTQELNRAYGKSPMVRPYLSYLVG